MRVVVLIAADGTISVIGPFSETAAQKYAQRMRKLGLDATVIKAERPEGAES